MTDFLPVGIYPPAYHTTGGRILKAKFCYFALFVATTLIPVPHTSAMMTSPGWMGRCATAVFSARATSKIFSLGTSPAVRTETTGPLRLCSGRYR